MLAFPQLASGAMAQMPFERTVRFRSRRNEARDGSVVEIGDPDYEERTWQLIFHELSDAEWQALADLFAAAGGRLKTFTFLEPGANLLQWSEQLAQTPWTVAGSVLDGQADSFGGARGSRLNAGSSAAQMVAAPSSYRYAASAWLRTNGGGAKLRVSDNGAQVREVDVDTSGQWKRYTVAYAATSATDQMKLELVAGGAALDIHGPQFEAQASASAYKVSSAQGGVFANARFDQDALVDEATGPGRHDTRVKLIWTPSQT
ncbi:MAG: hypothetical protein R2748_23250 [Bryobacterales bacterium]